MNKPGLDAQSNTMERKMFRSVRGRQFKKLFSRLPANVQETATQRFENYFALDQFHPLLRRHDLHDVDDAPTDSFAVEMHYGYRAVAFFDQEENTYVWFWCGTHAEYDSRFAEGR